MGKILSQVATEKAYEEHEELLSKELQEEADKISYGNAHKGVDVCIHRMSHVDPAYKKGISRWLLHFCSFQKDFRNAFPRN